MPASQSPLRVRSRLELARAREHRAWLSVLSNHRQCAASGFLRRLYFGRRSFLVYGSRLSSRLLEQDGFCRGTDRPHRRDSGSHREGTDFVANYGGNLVASDDEWCAPIAADVGPDGCVWVSDWYNIVVQHNPTPNGFKTGARGAYETPLRDKVHGRIYRIVPENGITGTSQPVALTTNTSTSDLVQTLKSNNMLWRLHAQRLLVERGDRDHSIAGQLISLIQDRSQDEIGLNVGAIHALRVLQGLADGHAMSDEVMQTWYGALKHPSAGVRRTAALSLPPSSESTRQIIDAGLLSDQQPLVRLAALTALADTPPSAASGNDQASSGATGAALVAALVDDLIANDKWIPDALTSAAARHDLAFLKAIAAKEFKQDIAPPALAVIERVAEHFARGDNLASLETLLATLGKTHPQAASAILGGLSKAWLKIVVQPYRPAWRIAWPSCSNRAITMASCA